MVPLNLTYLHCLQHFFWTSLQFLLFFNKHNHWRFKFKHGYNILYVCTCIYQSIVIYFIHELTAASVQPFYENSWLLYIIWCWNTLIFCSDCHWLYASLCILTLSVYITSPTIIFYRHAGLSRPHSSRWAWPWRKRRQNTSVHSKRRWQRRISRLQHTTKCTGHIPATLQTGMYHVY